MDGGWAEPQESGKGVTEGAGTWDREGGDYNLAVIG